MMGALAQKGRLGSVVAQIQAEIIKIPTHKLSGGLERHDACAKGITYVPLMNKVIWSLILKQKKENYHVMPDTEEEQIT